MHRGQERKLGFSANLIRSYQFTDLFFFIPSIGPEAAFLWLCEALLQTEADRPAMQLHMMCELRHQETNCSKTAAKLKSFSQVCLYFPNEHKKNS